MIIDIHAHALPQETLDSLADEARRFPNVHLHDIGGKPALSFADGKPTRPVNPKLRGLQPRLDFLTDEGIDRQMVGGWLDSFGYELEAEEGADWSRFLNEGMRAECSLLGALRPLATVPMQDGALAAEIGRAHV